MSALAFVGAAFGVGYALVNIPLPGRAASLSNILFWDSERESQHD